MPLQQPQSESAFKSFARYYLTLAKFILRDTFLTYGKDQIVALLIAILILAYQVKSGLISQDKTWTNVLAVVKPYLWVLGGYVTLHTFRAPWQLDRERGQEIATLHQKLNAPENLPPPALDRQLQKKNEQPTAGPRITGGMNEVYFYAIHTPDCGGMTFYVVMNVHIANDGIPTVIQGYRLMLTFFDRAFQSEPASCADFRIARAAKHNQEIIDELTDLRELHNTLLERHRPIDGWLCFFIRGLPAIQTWDLYYIKEIRLKLYVIDGAGEEHSILGSAPFDPRGRLERIG